MTAAASPEPSQVTICQVCGEIRRTTSMVPDPDGGMRCARPCKRNVGGRPPIGPPVLIRMPPELRAAVEALAMPGEKLAATTRRLLTEAVEARGREDVVGLAADMLSTFVRTPEGYRARVGQVQIGKWRARLSQATRDTA
jgi:hypothetical protein